ncbi:conserved hypothetical protein [Candida dubliniensis CD36]|uniref:Uncharacterized protein n=1 Tax=Candida dubliniensis (strain CD36 / ATCC MYA-646 / CBS 7987 / NCPF 3949 / NRRL Y-17841) TaxID=573826 RepID=B9WAQ9_CANDC|nr:conserved hypothetical protein [Candida dubliniensis CD36]CAX43479.1 conserved hypothetical protein [Candida dubliniensis CD36]
MLSLIDLKPDFVFSQYEISIIKSIWRSLDLNNPIILKDFYYTVSTTINNTGTTINGVLNPQRDTFTPLIITQQDIMNIINDYQVEEFIKVATSLIYHLEFGKELPENEIVQLSKRNYRIYKLYYKQYLTLGNSLMETIENYTNLLMGNNKQIFSRFLSILLSAILYYSNDVTFADTTTTTTTTTTATPTTTHSNASIYSEHSYSMFSLNTDNTSSSSSAATTTTTADVIALEEIFKPPQLADITPQDPQDPQNTTTDTDCSEDATITNSIYNNRLNNDDDDDVDDNTIENINGSTSTFDSSYDYLNSFSFSPDDYDDYNDYGDNDDNDENFNGKKIDYKKLESKSKIDKYKYNDDNDNDNDNDDDDDEDDFDDFDDTKSIVSTISNLSSSFKNWGINRKKSNKDKFKSTKKFIHKNILRNEK